MSMAVDFGYDEWEAPESDYFYHEEEDVPGPEVICRDCVPTAGSIEVTAEFIDPFGFEEETVEQARKRMTAAERAADMRFECGNTNPTIEAGDD